VTKVLDRVDKCRLIDGSSISPPYDDEGRMVLSDCDVLIELPRDPRALWREMAGWMDENDITYHSRWNISQSDEGMDAIGGVLARATVYRFNTFREAAHFMLRWGEYRSDVDIWQSGRGDQ